MVSEPLLDSLRPSEAAASTTKDVGRRLSHYSFHDVEIASLGSLSYKATQKLKKLAKIDTTINRILNRFCRHISLKK